MLCDVTLSVYPHRAGLKNMPGHGGIRTYDLWNTSPMLNERINMKQDSVLFLCFFIYYTFYYTKQSYLHGRIWNHFISNSKFIDKGSLVLY